MRVGVFRHGVTIRQVNPRAEEVLLYADCHGVPLRNRQPKVSVRILDFLLEVFQPVFWLIRFIFRLVNPVLFSWWLKPLFERWVRNGFAEDLKQAIPALFDLHGGRVVTDPNPRANDSNMDYVCISSPTLVFKFRRWHRENYEIEVAPTFAPTDFYQLLDVLHVVDPTLKTERGPANESWYLWGRLLEPRFELLEKAFSAESFQDTKVGLERGRFDK